MRHEDEWVKVAMADDSLVVNLLLHLHQPPPPPPPLPLRWTVRQRRSKSIPSHRALPNNVKVEHTRASPTTPLSWSGGATSSSGGALDGCEDSSCPTKHTHAPRSKVANPSETAITRKPRKKTLAELKEQEHSLLQERRSLKNELSSLRLTVEKHRAINKRLKRLELDLESKRNSKTAKTPHASSEAQEMGNKASIIVLPDLNLPVEEDLIPNFMP